MKKAFFILLAFLSAIVLASNNEEMKDKSSIDEKNFQSSDEINKDESSNFSIKTNLNNETEYSCLGNLKDLDKDISPKAYTDCRRIENAFSGFLSSCYHYAGTCYWCRIVLPGGPTGEWGCY